MGIYAKGEQLPATRVSDTPQDRYGELADPNDIGGGGSTLGQVIADSKATASSANDTAGTLADDLTALESKVDGLEEIATISGTGWSAYKRAGVVTLSFSNMDGATTGMVLPVGFRPGAACYFPIAYSHNSVGARFTITTGGVVTFFGELPNPVFTTATFVAVN